jgi:uncharacterized membrane protein YccC
MCWSQRRFPFPASCLRTAAKKCLSISRRDVWYSLRMLVVILGPLLVAGRFQRLPGFPDDSSFLMLGAFFTTLAASDGTYGRRARIMGLGACLEVGACLFGSLLGNKPLLALAVMVFWAFGAGMLTVFGKAGGKLSYIAIASFVTAVASPAGLSQAGLRCTILLSGALWAMTLHLWAWPLKRYRPLRHTVARYYLTLQAVLTSLRLSLSRNSAGDEHLEEDFWEQRTSAQNARKEAHQILDEVSHGSSATTWRLALFLERADALFNVQIAFAESLRVIPLQEYPPLVQETLVQAIAVLEKTLAQQSSAIWLGQPLERKDDLAQALRETTENLATAWTRSMEETTNVLGRARLEHLLHLLKRLLALCQKSLASMDTPRPDVLITQGRQNASLCLTLANAWRTLAEHVVTRSRIVRYALRLSITVSLATALFLFVKIPHGYWMAMSATILLRPDFHTTRQRIRLRLGGTIAGGILVGALSLVLYQQGLLLLLMVLLCFLAFLARSRHYGVYAFFLTAFLVLSIDSTHLGDWMVALVRVASNLTGAVLAYLSTSLLWPRWEQKKMPDQVGSALTAIRCFFHGTMSLYGVPSSSTTTLKELRLRASRECFRAIRLLDRLALEPWSSHDHRMRYAALRRSLRQLCETVTVLSISLPSTTGDNKALPEIARLSAQVEKALEDVEEAVRCRLQPGRRSQGAQSLLAVEETLRGVLTGLSLAQPLHTRSERGVSRDALHVAPPPLSVYFPSLMQALRKLYLAGCEASVEERQRTCPPLFLPS